MLTNLWLLFLFSGCDWLYLCFFGYFFCLWWRMSAHNFIGQFFVLMNKNRFCRATVSCQTTSDYYSMLLKLTYMMIKKSFKYVQMLRIRTRMRQFDSIVFHIKGLYTCIQVAFSVLQPKKNPIHTSTFKKNVLFADGQTSHLLKWGWGISEIVSRNAVALESSLTILLELLLLFQSCHPNLMFALVLNLDFDSKSVIL